MYYPSTLIDPSSWTVYPASKLRWTTELLVSEFRNLAVFGLENASFVTQIAPDHVSLEIRADLFEPLGTAVVEDLCHERFGLEARLRAVRDLVLREPPSIKAASGRRDIELGIAYSTMIPAGDDRKMGTSSSAG
jgi:hypothetical protein